MRDAALAANAERAGTSLQELQRGSSVDTAPAPGRRRAAGLRGRGWAFTLAFLFYFAALGFGYTLSGSIVEEKANRIVEIITTKIPVRQLLIGKIAGNTLLASGRPPYRRRRTGRRLLHEYSVVPARDLRGVGWFAVFFLVGFTFIACWWAVAGALASRAETCSPRPRPLSTS